jgi:hypothetical protein
MDFTGSPAKKKLATSFTIYEDQMEYEGGQREAHVVSESGMRHTCNRDVSSSYIDAVSADSSP